MVEPPHDPDAGCKLLDGFAIVIQVLLASTALGTLVVKRATERPQRPVNIWYETYLSVYKSSRYMENLSGLIGYWT
jgi:hypothetical protein